MFYLVYFKSQNKNRFVIFFKINQNFKSVMIKILFKIFYLDNFYILIIKTAKKIKISKINLIIIKKIYYLDLKTILFFYII